MIYYVCHPSHSYTCGVILLWYGDELRPLFRLVPYGMLELLYKAGPGVIIWTDFDRLDQTQLSDVATVQAGLVREDLIQLNHALRSEQRFGLLTRLHREGRNGFGVRRPYESLDGLRYPVFLRDEVGALHTPPQLLHDRPSLEAAIARLPASGMTRPMVVEFGARPAPDGYYRKYGAYRVGDRIYPQHCLSSLDWFIKMTSILSRAHYPEHLEYIERNPHAAELRQLFDDAHIQYGRMDYTIIDGRVQVFEINTNPAVLDRPPTPEDEIDPAPYARRHIEALLALPDAARRASDNRIDLANDLMMQELRIFYGLRN